MKRYAAELVGTFVLVFGGCGSAGTAPVGGGQRREGEDGAGPPVGPAPGRVSIPAGLVPKATLSLLVSWAGSTGI